MACVMMRAALFFLLLAASVYAQAGPPTTHFVDVGCNPNSCPNGELSFNDHDSDSSATTITAGDTVYWSWLSGTHSTTSGTCTPTGNCTHTGLWDSGVLPYNFSSPPFFTRTFQNPGIYPYFCTVHDNAMTGVVIVRPNFAAVQYQGATNPIALALADVNGDGILDVLSANNGASSVSVWLGSPAPNRGALQQPRTDYAAGIGPAAVAAGNFSGGGGGLDIAEANLGDGAIGQVGIMPRGVFSPEVDFPVGRQPRSIAVADFDHDGNLDLAVANFGGMMGFISNSVSILKGNGDGTFVVPAPLVTVGTEPSFVVTADFNQDGNPDLAVANSADGTVSILLGNGDGTFQTHRDFQVGAGPNGIAVGDVNGDGKLDLVVANSADGTISVLLGNGDGSFQTAVPYSMGPFARPQSVALLDINSDGNLDIAVADNQHSGVQILMGDGKGGFQPAGALTPPFPATQYIVTGDLDGDGLPDLVAADVLNNVWVFLNREPKAPAVPGPATHLAVTSPTTVNAGSAFSVTVTALDDYERVVPSYTGTIQFSSTDGTATLPGNYTFTSGTGLDNGTHTFNGLNGVILTSAAQLQSVFITDNSVTPLTASTSDITVVPGPAVKLLMTGQPATISVGQAFSVNVTLYDQYDNIATGYPGTVHFTTSDSTGLPPPNSPLTNGAGSFNYDLFTVGNWTLTATDTVNNGLTSTTAPVAVLAVSTTIGLTVAPDQSTFRQPVTLTATVAPQVGVALPVGNVIFSDKGKALKTKPVICVGTSCQATFTSSQWTIGAHSLSALFLPGNPNFQSSALPTPVIRYHAPKPIQRGP